MIIGLSDTAYSYLGTVQDIIWLFYPGARFSTAAEGDLTIQLILNDQDGNLWAEAQLFSSGMAVAHRETGQPWLPGEKQNELKRLARLAVYRLLVSYSGRRPSPWGIMTGIRPTKVVHRLFDLGWPATDIERYLAEKYALAQEKAALITAIAKTQRPYLLSGTSAARLVSVYIGIPFCPTRCLYCSFPSYSIKQHRTLVEPFLNALLKEIREVGEALQARGLHVQTVYLGGGTPTSLGVDQLSSLLASVNRYLRTDETVEITVEGGRPDTLTREVLAVLAQQGVTRLSINPQSMQQHTLDAIGRSHTVEDIYRATEEARHYKFNTVNMDIIIGLPGETVQDVAHTMRHLRQLKPENLTVHALALKRASHLKQRLAEFSLTDAAQAAAMWEEAARAAQGMGLQPYYMYRQKQMVGNLENIGYTLPGHACIYNIQMIEERQTVIGLGVGAGSKWVNPLTHSLVNQYNAKEPRQYVERLDEYLSRKINRIKQPVAPQP
ncbi:coproporphyrinogen dehydrogenase HemZ [Desulforamulus hydrothermalis]|uniref:Coproporphyrinogen III oxidase, anaerobic n=1 Tax=Desulforamulus hydrothermalis Lam5 = DSM 18033 TaxID=1121428 RepID=K8DYU3_9FIRM|nr:coproporphyrinogen dehydrogenase HemZ [Desulforamulus hydrothermalis]CCO08074.1 Coproporphyrinogen III oxidase, anaerobic [Desulforamulus hydrothermalis Lam5 = DSM 18033]SHG82635.1 oxygen-independent coproporphyrinogen-3 oxidase [Desulforamulus hydrothermalis Lam5 = DSM 18033]